jgi:hypothetical protein
VEIRRGESIGSRAIFVIAITLKIRSHISCISAKRSLKFVSDSYYATAFVPIGFDIDIGVDRFAPDSQSLLRSLSPSSGRVDGDGLAAAADPREAAAKPTASRAHAARPRRLK